MYLWGQCAIYIICIRQRYAYPGRRDIKHLICTDVHLEASWLLHSWLSLLNGLRIWEVGMKDNWADRMKENHPLGYDVAFIT